MGLPPRVFWTLNEAAARWGCLPADVAAWSVAGKVEISAGIPPVACGDEMVSGIVAIAAADILPMFRRCGSGPRSAAVRRVRRSGEEDWLIITDPNEGVQVETADLVIEAAELTRFEEDHELFKRPHAGRGPEPRYDWDGMFVQVILRVHEQGIPDTQAEFVSEMQEWFTRRSEGGDVPDERSIRRRLNPVWRALREAG